ncbi:streptomycin 6-kinase [Rathayibacter oskolensis]|uniref:Streptomycin 6-kinase n=1 Tax=Rathayibacter oskolensis TaxID=1891671 RepID=A0A1X7MU40_9MICO|nr:aminoglycoside phosphotransferase family protein [Rathayibacter oskolensis]SMH28275.1 streptomycin 6-kinase [Rathayibacter oskolensis]
MIAVPQSFRAMPRWWGDERGRAWLDELPRIVESRCSSWGLDIDGEPLHGSNALVVPVRRGREAAVLRLAPPGDDVSSELAALTHWDGRGVVRLLDSAPEAGASLLERLDHTRSLLAEPLHTAVVTLGELTRLLAVPAPTSAPSTRVIAREESVAFPAEWEALGRPTSRALLDAATGAASWLGDRHAPPLSVDGDLHFEQVLAGSRSPWVVVDPVLLQGDPEYDLGRILWSRLDELEQDADVHRAFEGFVAAAEVPPERARAWVLVRSMSYLLWGLRHGLTLDPPKCERLLRLFA